MGTPGSGTGWSIGFDCTLEDCIVGMSRRVLLLAKPNGQNISLLLVAKNKDSIPKKNNVLSKYDWMQKLNMDGGISPDFDAHHQGNLYDSHYTSNYILTYCIDKKCHHCPPDKPKMEEGFVVYTPTIEPMIFNLA
jgi:hypothetical protein